MAGTDGRYLSAGEKRRILAQWSAEQRHAIGRDGLGGEGWPDRDVLPLCEVLNSLPGVCTVQSCAGHGRPGWVDYPGCLWLRLDRRTSEAFEKHASVLAGMREIDRVSKIYNEDGKEVVAIEFAGNERNLLAESQRRIVRFFEQLILGG